MRTFAVFSFVALAVAALLDPIGHDRTEHIIIWTAQGIVAFAAIIVLCLYLRLYYRADIKLPNPRTIENITPVLESEAYELQKFASKIRMNAVQARILALAILEPGQLRQRVVENWAGSLYLERASDVDRYKEALMRLRADALDIVAL
jgi:hypothetical protein